MNFQILALGAAIVLAYSIAFYDVCSNRTPKQVAECPEIAPNFSCPLRIPPYLLEKRDFFSPGCCDMTVLDRCFCVMDVSIFTSIHDLICTTFFSWLSCARWKQRSSLIDVGISSDIDPIELAPSIRNSGGSHSSGLPCLILVDQCVYR